MKQRRAQRVELVEVQRRVPQLAVRERDAARMLGLSWYTYQAAVRPFVRSFRHGRVVIVPVAELAGFLDRAAVRQEHR